MNKLSTFSNSLLSFHSLYFFSLGIFALFFSETMLLSMTKNVTTETIQLNRYFGLMEITAGLFLHEIIQAKIGIIRPLIYLIFISIVSLYLMMFRITGDAVGVYYVIFRVFLLFLLLIALVKEYKHIMKQ
jgi:hypothetical protein